MRRNHESYLKLNCCRFTNFYSYFKRKGFDHKNEKLSSTNCR